jgi:hypothetical protein
MPITKAKFDEQYERALARVGQLKELGKTDPEIIQILKEEKFYNAVLSKIFKMSGSQLARSKTEEDAKLAEKTFTEQKDGKKPLREKEIEDAAWFHNLLHDVGKHVFTKMVKFVEWGDQDMNDYEKARAKLCSFIDSVQALIEDSGKIKRLEEEKELLDIQLIETHIVLDQTVQGIKTLKWYNELLISMMPPERLRQVFDQVMITSALRFMPQGLAKAEMGAPIVE